jgi:signal transduction histidine kinase
VGADGGQVVVLASVDFVRDDRGRELGAVVALNDVTEARRATIVRDELFEFMSHELRTPLTVISGLAPILTRPGLDAESRLEMAVDIAAAGERMTTIVESGLKLAQVEFERIEPEPMLVPALIRNVIAAHLERFPRSNVQPQPVARGLMALGSEAWVEVALENLLTNAATYGEPGAPIIIEAGADGGEVRIRVCNSGPSLPPEEYGAVFQAFYRGPGHRATTAGAGLGLTVARRLIEAQGGTVEGGPLPGGGSVFTIQLPAVVVPAELQVP